MQKSQHPLRNGKTFSYSTLTYGFIVFFIAVTFTIILLHFHFFQSALEEKVYRDTEREAFQFTSQMARVVKPAFSQNHIIISDQLREYLQLATNSEAIWKIKLFSASGEVLFSTNAEDIGDFNHKPYFKEQVTSGQAYSKLAKKNSVSLDLQPVTLDVMETYVPIMDKGNFLGAYELYYNVSDHILESHELIKKSSQYLLVLAIVIFIMAILTLVALKKVIASRQKYERLLVKQATIDSLTNTLNRGHIESLIEREIERFKRYGRNASIIMFDLDHFKKINDQFGHQFGDTVLKGVAQVCKDSLRSGDLLGRYGGEEFIICLPEIDVEQSYRVAEKIRVAIRNTAFKFDAKEIRVTASGGIINLVNQSKLSFDDIMTRVDDALYEAKALGRDRFIASDEPTASDQDR